MCGGLKAIVDELDEDQQETRILNGCDGAAQPSPRYAITCAHCEGVGCSECEGGPRRGLKLVDRCPMSFLTPEFAEYLRARSWSKRGIYPYGRDFMNLPSRYAQFTEELEGEIARVEQAEFEAAAEKAKG